MTSTMPPAYEGDKPYIFISYSHKDSDLILRIIRGLQESGFRVWYDAGIEVGTEWPEYIAQHIINAGCVVCFISEASHDSQNCRREINFAIDLKKKMFTVYLEQFELSPGMRLQLNTVQGIFMYNHKNFKSFMDSLERAELLADCRETLSVPEPEDRDPEELYELGMKYMNGDPEDQSFEKAADAFETAANLGLAKAQFALAECYHLGTGVHSSSETAAFWYQKAADQGYTEAIYSLAGCYYFGDGVEENAKKAAELFEEAAKAGHSDAQRLLGECYLHGNGVPQDYYDAVKWYSKSAALGNIHSLYALGLCYFDYYGYELAPCEYDRAFDCFSGVADANGYPLAFYMLGICFEHGYGTAKDLTKAKEMYQIAAENHCPDAKEALKRFQTA